MYSVQNAIAETGIAYSKIVNWVCDIESPNYVFYRPELDS